MTKKENKPLLTRTTYQEQQQKERANRTEQTNKATKNSEEWEEKRKKKGSSFSFRSSIRKQKAVSPEDIQQEKDLNGFGERLTKKEQGRQLDFFYNWAIFLVLVVIVLVFVLAFVI